MSPATPSSATSRQVVTIGFGAPLLRMFPVDVRSTRSARRNEMTIDFDDPRSISVRFLAKEPGPEMRGRWCPPPTTRTAPSRPCCLP